MAGKRKSFPLRLDPVLYAAIERLAADDLRSVNAEIEFLLRQAVRKRAALIIPEGGGSEEDS
ncbi:toxin-antitoxin system HicB family antitoxin [bacterium]|nr:toxin-antitoxin system HicB family antitoxin [bacterium]